MLSLMGEAVAWFVLDSIGARLGAVLWIYWWKF